MSIRDKVANKIKSYKTSSITNLKWIIRDMPKADFYNKIMTYYGHIENNRPFATKEDIWKEIDKTYNETFKRH